MNKDKTDGLTVDAVIPTFQPGKRLIGILECLEKQTLPVRCVRIINSGRDGFRLFLEEAHLTEQQFLESYPFVLLKHIPKEEFDHGRTRSKGFAACIGAEFPAPACLVVHNGSAALRAELMHHAIQKFLFVLFHRVSPRMLHLAAKPLCFLRKAGKNALKMTRFSHIIFIERSYIENKF